MITIMLCLRAEGIIRIVGTDLLLDLAAFTVAASTSVIVS